MSSSATSSDEDDPTVTCHRHLSTVAASLLHHRHLSQSKLTSTCTPIIRRKEGHNPSCRDGPKFPRLRVEDKELAHSSTGPRHLQAKSNKIPPSLSHHSGRAPLRPTNSFPRREHPAAYLICASLSSSARALVVVLLPVPSWHPASTTQARRAGRSTPPPLDSHPAEPPRSVCYSHKANPPGKSPYPYRSRVAGALLHRWRIRLLILPVTARCQIGYV
jgi:hypothetical protein